MPKFRHVNRELTIEFIVGSFIASVVIVLILFTIVISGGRFNVRRHTLEARFNEVMGLRRHDNVLVRGMPVGSVKSLELMPDHVRVELLLDAPLELREGYRLRVEPASMLGGSHLVIEQGDGEPLAEGEPIWGDPPRDLIADVSNLAQSVRESLVEGGTLENIRSASADLASVVARVERGEGLVGRLLSDDDQLYQDLSGTVANLRMTTERLNAGEGLLGRLLSADDGFYEDLRETVAVTRRLADRIERGEGTVGRLLGPDDTLYENLNATVASLRTVADRLDRGEGALGKLLGPDETLYQEILTTAQNLSAITTRLETGEGTLGKLLSADDQLYRDLRGLVENAREAFDDLRETTPLVTFSSIMFGAF